MTRVRIKGLRPPSPQSARRLTSKAFQLRRSRLWLGGSSDQVVQALNSCSNQLQTVTVDFPTWWSGNTSISTTSTYQINGVAVGTTTNNAQSKNMYWGPKEDSGGGPCQVSQAETSGNT